ncbi:MAG: HEPN domain-containing protein [Cytophagaceae bacterium]|nr:HEPN domain-containing protein [Cytophagaceae bacterium]
MISLSDLISIANERLIDAETLLHAHRYDGAVYLCGYSVEIALKHKICQTLNWPGFPSINKEFEKFKSLKTHDLDVLLSFTGIETTLKSTHLAEFSAIANWNPEARYNPTGIVSFTDATFMINSAKTLIGML